MLFFGVFSIGLLHPWLELNRDRVNERFLMPSREKQVLEPVKGWGNNSKLMKDSMVLCAVGLNLGFQETLRLFAELARLISQDCHGGGDFGHNDVGP
jgi:hypothetical protein